MQEEATLAKLKDRLKGANETDQFLVDVLTELQAAAKTRAAVAKTKVGAAVKRIVEERPADSNAHKLAQRIMEDWKVRFAAAPTDAAAAPSKVPGAHHYAHHSQHAASSPAAAHSHGHHQSVAAKPSSSAVLPHDPKRQKTCSLLQEVFVKDEQFPLELRVGRAIEMEAAMFSLPPPEYAAKYRSFRHNLPRNATLRVALLEGTVSSSTLVGMTAEELASDDHKQALSKDVIELADAKRSDWMDDNIEKIKQQAGVPVGSEGLFKCAKCGSKKTSNYQKQTRSADEPMTVFVQCLTCKNKWRC